MSSENTHHTNQLLRRNTAQVLSIAISAVGVVVALVANIIFYISSGRDGTRTRDPYHVEVVL
jgi:hypothetical protein